MGKVIDEVELELEEGGRNIKEKLKTGLKLLFIILCYGSSFVTMVQLGSHLVKIPTFNPIILHTDLITWIETKWTHSVWWDTITQALLKDMALLLLFGLQHTGLTKRVLEDTRAWLYAHHIHKIDRPLYLLTTAVALQLVINKWEAVPLVLWTAEWLQDYFTYVHILAWLILYGTNLMLDLPDMAGFNQVVISSPNFVSKSPDLQMMYRTQRHMGLFPFTLILLVHPLMTLDRFILTVSTLSYSYVRWKSPTCYEYVLQMKSLRGKQAS